MSYDFGIGDYSSNYTWNVSEMFYEHIPVDDEGKRGGIHQLHGLTGKQASRLLSRFFRSAHDEILRIGPDAFQAKYDPENKWGSAIGGLIIMAELLAACADHPRKRVYAQ